MDYPDFRVILIDNGSADGSLQELTSRFGGHPAVEIVDTGSNLGFAGGNNVGLQLAVERGAEFAWLLNNDTVVDPGALTELVAAARAHPEAGIFGSKIYYYDHPDVLWFAGGIVDREGAGHSVHIGQDERDCGQYDEVRTVDYITGCSMLVPVDLVRSAGVMEDDYFLYWEEVDYNARIHEAGRTSLYVPASKIWHKVSQSFGDAKPLQIRYETRNRLLYHSRHMPERLATVRRLLLREALGMLARRQWSLAVARIRGTIDFELGHLGPVR